MAAINGTNMPSPCSLWPSRAGALRSWSCPRRIREEAARSLRTLLDNLEGLRIFDIDKHHHQQVGKMLDRLRGAKLTYVDASSLCFMERHKIKIVWSTDHHLGLTGAEVLPRV
jgi:predicted nucleic acid-binding protein